MKQSINEENHLHVGDHGIFTLVSWDKDDLHSKLRSFLKAEQCNEENTTIG